MYHLIIFRWQIPIVRSWARPAALQNQPVALGPDQASEDRTQQHRALGRPRHPAGPPTLPARASAVYGRQWPGWKQDRCHQQWFSRYVFLCIQMHVPTSVMACGAYDYTQLNRGCLVAAALGAGAAAAPRGGQHRHSGRTGLGDPASSGRASSHVFLSRKTAICLLAWIDYWHGKILIVNV